MKITPSIWNSFAHIDNYPSLSENVTTDVAIIGAGITGISVSKLLGERGISNIVLESRKVGISSTSHSTGNLYSTIDSNLFSLANKYNSDTVNMVIKSRAEALEQMVSWIDTHHINCDFKRVPMFLYSSDDLNSEKIREEKKVGNETILEISTPDSGGIPYTITNILKIERQAQINPMRYVQGLAKSLPSEKTSIYEKTRVHSIAKGDSYTLHTNRGTVIADIVVHATHTPKGIKVVHLLLGPYREYGIACRLKNNEQEKLPQGIFWGYYGESKYSSRIYKSDNKTYLIIVGEPHKVGHKKNNEECFYHLHRFATRHFDVQEPEYYWGGQHYRPADLLPYIGPYKKNSKEYIATGYSTDGLVYGTLAAQIISDSISGKKNAYSELYRATRKRPGQSISRFMKENIGVAKHLVETILKSSSDEVKNIKKGEGKIIRHNGEKIAVSRDNEGNLKLVSATCTHMGCTVKWNHSEKSWDCPCHGSRFDDCGNILEGPAFDKLTFYEKMNK